MDEGHRVTLLPRMRRDRWAVLGVILVAAFALRAARLGELPGGFLVFNEGFYIDLATRMAAQPAFAWFLHPLDVNNPPLFSAIVSLLYRLGAPHVAGARAVSVLAGVWSVYVTFLLGRLLFDERTGLLAAALLAAMPGVVLVDHNIQVDPLFVALMLTSVCLYVHAARAGSGASAVAGGVLLGLACIVKQPAVVVVPVLALWETWSSRGFRWLRARRAWLFLVAFVLVGAPWYVAQVLTKSAESMFSNAADIAATSRNYGSVFWLKILGRELLWMLFPFTAALVVWGWARQAIRRTAGDKLVLVASAAFLAWYLVFHRHTYYLLPLAPFAALAAARATSGLERLAKPVRTVLLGVLLTAMVLGSVLMMTGHKWGRWSLMSLEPPSASAARTVLFVEPDVQGFVGPTVNLVDPRFEVQILSAPDFASRATDTADTSLLLSGELVNGDNAPLKPSQVLYDTRLRPVFFGFAIALLPPDLTSSQFFGELSWSAEKVGPFWDFGLRSAQVPSGLYLYDRGSF